MRWLQLGVALTLLLHVPSAAFAQDVSRPPKPVRRHPPQVFFDRKAPDLMIPLRRYDAQPIQLQSSAIDALRSGKLPSERTEPTAPKPMPADDNDHNRRLSELGALELYPKFNEHDDDATPLDPKAVIAKVRGAIERNLLPNDGHSKTVLEYARIVSRARSDSDKVERKLLYITARRVIDGIPVDGPGSRFTIAFDAQARVRGVVYDWSKIVSQSPAMEAAERSRDPRAQIREQVRQALPRANVRVQHIDLVYYDFGGGKPLIPAFRYVAEIERNKNTLFTSEHLVGYVPLLDGQPELPQLRTNIVENREQPSLRRATPSAPGAVLVGRFVAREDSTGWHKGAEDFWRALSGSPGPITFADAGGPIAATPAMFGVDRDDYVNSVDVALVEAHGLPMGFTTKRDSHDKVYIERDVQPPGLGSGSGGRLKHWVLHSCRAVPAPGDFKGEWAPLWKNVFNGVSSVVGYRTPMFVADGAEAALGTSLRAGAPVVPAWFNAVNSLSIYGLDALARFQCEDLGPVGRASAVMACGQADARADQGGPVPTDCLEMWWVENELITLSAPLIGGNRP